jgi:hypothetical protein
MRGARPPYLFAPIVVALLLAQPARADRAPDPVTPTSQRIYVKAIPDQKTWLAYSRKLGSDRFGKFIIDIKSGDIYYIDVNVFKLHADFVLGVLLNQEWTAENIIEYNKNYERDKPRFILGYLTHHLKIDKFTFAFWEGDKIDAAGVKRVKDELARSFFVKKIAYRPDSPAQEKVAKQVARKFKIKTLTNDEIYKEAPYQAFNRGRAVGTLRVVPPGTPYEQLTFDRHDIVILQESYPDISPVSGIMSTVFSTPLAHVNLRAIAWGIPNAGYVRAIEKYADLDGEKVYYEVTDTGHTLRKATEAEIAELDKRMDRARRVVLPPARLDNANLAMLTAIRRTDVNSYGAKTANLGEIASADLDGVHVPAGFGVPFFYYVRHMKQHGLDRKLRALLDDPKFDSDAAWRRAQLKELRTAIREAPMDHEVLDALYKRVRLELGGVGVFVRSSTNAEDLAGFNGAGLYDTVPNVRGKRQLGEAVKQVWASLWNWRAVEERSLFGIDHGQVYPGVMIQIGVNPTAAGVLITTNLYNPEDGDSFTINAKWGLGIRVVQGTKVPEQIIFDTSNDGTKIISRSDDPVMLVFDEAGGVREVPTPGGGVILSEERAKRLSNVVERFMPLFPADNPLDVEWLFEGDHVWIVQSRPYVSGKHR